MATAPTPPASSREQSLLAGVSQRVTTKLTSLVELRRRRWHGHNEGSRELHRRLRVGQWEDPPASNQAPSQAAVLFDIAYTTSMMHHADMLTAADSSLTGYATVAYFFTVVQLILHWWSVSLFLCKLDVADGTYVPQAEGSVHPDTTNAAASADSARSPHGAQGHGSRARGPLTVAAVKEAAVEEG